MHCNAKNNFALSIKSDVLHYHYTRMKRQLQYSCLCAKNNHTPFRPLTPRSRAHFTSSLASSHSLLLFSLHTGLLHLLCTRPRLLVSRFSSLFLGMSVSLMPLACMYTLHACSASCFHYRTCFPTVLVHFSSHASWLHALTSYHTLHYCSVLVQRTSRQSELCRCLATSAQHPLPAILLCTCYTSSRTLIRE